MQKWKKLSSKIVFTNPWLTLAQDQVELPTGAVIEYLRTENHKEAAFVLALQDGKVLLQHEYSYPPDKVMVQLPGGAVEAGESPIEAARRELAEESGYKAERMELLGVNYMDNRRSNAKMYIFLAQDVTACERPPGDPQEFIESFWAPLSSIPKDIASGVIDNVTVLIAWAFYTAKQGTD
jgi:ADP-ribose pyrophosphatase